MLFDVFGLTAGEQETVYKVVVNQNKEWNAMSAATNQSEDDETCQERRNLGRLCKGFRTSERLYYKPILQAFEEAGGSTPMGLVLDRVYKLMKGILKDVDHQPLVNKNNKHHKFLLMILRYGEGNLRKVGLPSSVKEFFCIH
jgi:hypothetical protein